jgi:N-acetylmuramoyl-L-alanine amidase
LTGAFLFILTCRANSVKKRIEMMKYSRSFITAFITCAILLSASPPALPSYNSEAGHKYAVASQRFSDLKKSRKKRKYRSYWIDCVRTFELVEKQYPKSPKAADACFDRAEIYQELYRYNKRTRDINESLRLYDSCRSTYAHHARAPEALYHIVEIELAVKKDRAAAEEAFAKLAREYRGSDWIDKAKAKISPSARHHRKRETAIRKMPVPVISASKGLPAGAVKNIRFWSGGAYTRIVIDQDREVKFQALELKKPDRLVFDLLNTSLDTSVYKDPLPVNDGILKQVRASQYTPDVVRVVLDLASLKSYAAFPLHDPERLVIDVTGEGGRDGETSLTSAGTPQDGNSAGQKLESKEQPNTGPAATVPLLPKIPAAQNGEDRKLSLSRQLGLKIKTIAIDAGHGGQDPGAIGKNGLKEKAVTLDVAKRLAALVKDRLGCNVIMTRDKDVFIPLEDRPAIAKTRGADLFVSIHVNANRKRRTRGIETYVQSLRASDREAMATAARENAMSTKKLSQLKSELDRIFAELTRDDKIEESLYLADSVQGSLVSNLRSINSHADDLKARIKRAFFYVLINTEMPSILAEIGFISNPAEEKLLRKDSYRQEIAEALYKGIEKYVKSRSQQIAGL